MNRETARLKTEVVKGRVHAHGCCVFKDNPDTEQVEDLEHDALYAHALVRALSECRDPDGDRAYTETSVAANAAWILKRADELMREWSSK